MFARSATRTKVSHERLETMDGDALVTSDVIKAVEGVDAVLQTLGAPLNMKLIRGPVTLFSKSTSVLLPAMKSAGVTRLVALTGFGAGDSKPAVHSLQRPGFNAVLGKAYADKAEQERMIKASDLEWTIARPGVLRNGTSDADYRVITDPKAWCNGVTRRADVAHFMVRAAESNQYAGLAPVLISHGFLPFT